MPNQMTVNNKLKRALELYQEQRIAILEEKIDYESEFSENFEKRMQRLIRFQRKPYYKLINTAGKKAVACILVIIISFSATVFSVKALREPFINFIIEIYEKYSYLIYPRKDKPDDGQTEGRVYEPSYLPEGFSLNAKMDAKDVSLRHYINAEGLLILYEQSKTENEKKGIDTEEADYEEIMINTHSGLYLLQKGCHHLYWSDGKYTFYLIVPNNIAKEEVFKIAESVRE